MKRMKETLKNILVTSTGAGMGGASDICVKFGDGAFGR